MQRQETGVGVLNGADAAAIHVDPADESSARHALDAVRHGDAAPTAGAVVPPRFHPHSIPDLPPRLQEAAIFMFVCLAASAVLTPISRALGRILERRYATPTAAVRAHSVPALADDRLRRMEQSIEAVAIEVERIAEGQRFTTRLLSERERVG